MKDTPSSERRKYSRYDTELEVYFHVNYDVRTKVKYQKMDKKHEKPVSSKHSAVSKNVSAEGLCFTSDQALKEGDFLFLEVYVPKAKEPIIMEGEVRWSGKGTATAKKTDKVYTGVKLVTVNGISVHDSVYFDEPNKIVWSAVLESVLGKYRTLGQKKSAA